VYDYSTQQNVKRRSLENVPIEVNQRVDTETTMTLELRSEDPASTAAPLVVQVGVSQDVNNIPSLTRLLIPQPVSFTPAPTRMRVMCVNLWNYNFWIHRKALLLREIQRANPDVHFNFFRFLLPTNCFVIQRTLRVCFDLTLYIDDI
jgi:hypothetical protein